MMMHLEAKLTSVLSPYPPHSKIWVAYSGGVDSTLLLVLAAKVCQQLSLSLSAIHVHHGVAEQADEWVMHCQRQCALLNLELQVQYLTPASKISEAQLRQDRYFAFAKTVGAHEPLLLAHHQQDQAETLLLRLCRGTGVYGLQGMQAQRAQNNLLLLRPWLGISRQQIVETAQQLQLQWIEDPSNQRLSFRRNFMRHQVLPLLQQQWPVATQQLSQLAEQAQQQQRAQAWLLEPHLKKVCLTPTVLSLIELQKLPIDVQRLLLANWLRGLMGELVSDAWINNLLEQHTAHHQHYHLYDFQQCLWFVDTQAQGQLQGDLGGLHVRYRQGGERVPRAANRPHHTLKNLFQDLQVPPWLRAEWPLLYRGEQLIAIPHLWVHSDYQQDKVADVIWQHPHVLQWLAWQLSQEQSLN
jgi:tRNA(Ile)-lysidine synthase